MGKSSRVCGVGGPGPNVSSEERGPHPASPTSSGAGRVAFPLAPLPPKGSRSPGVGERPVEGARAPAWPVRAGGSGRPSPGPEPRRAPPFRLPPAPPPQPRAPQSARRRSLRTAAFYCFLAFYCFVFFCLLVRFCCFISLRSGEKSENLRWSPQAGRAQPGAGGAGAGAWGLFRGGASSCRRGPPPPPCTI